MSFSGALSGESPGLTWVDADEYATGLLGESPPWGAVDGLVAWQQRVTALIDTDVIAVKLDAVLEAQVTADESLVAKLAAKRRNPAPLRALLSSELVRAHLTDLVHSLGTAFSAKAIVVVVPAPDDLVVAAYRWAFHGETPELDEDDVDSAAVYVADLLRAVSAERVDALVISPPGPDAVETSERADLYTPIAKVADHYRWPLGLGVEVVGAEPAFWLAAEPVYGSPTGVMVSADFWSGAQAPPLSAGFRLIRVPAGLQPESVLARLTELRVGP